MSIRCQFGESQEERVSFPSLLSLSFPTFLLAKKPDGSLAFSSAERRSCGFCAQASHSPFLGSCSCAAHCVRHDGELRRWSSGGGRGGSCRLHWLVKGSEYLTTLTPPRKITLSTICLVREVSASRVVGQEGQVHLGHGHSVPHARRVVLHHRPAVPRAGAGGGGLAGGRVLTSTHAFPRLASGS